MNERNSVSTCVQFNFSNAVVVCMCLGLAQGPYLVQHVGLQNEGKFSNGQIDYFLKNLLGQVGKKLNK